MTALPGPATRTVVPILVVDDNAAKRMAVRAVLQPLGYLVVEAESGVAALRRIMEQDFAVIFLDVRMPGMDGFETASLIRQRRQSEMTPIIFLTAYAADEINDNDRYSEGAVDFMFAPVKPEVLRAKVSVFANLFRKADGLATQARDVQRSADQLRLLTDAAPIGIFQTDEDNRYLYTNPRWSEITGVPAAEALGRPWDSVVGEADRAADETAEGNLTDVELSHRFRIERSGEATRIVLVTSRPIADSDVEGAGGWVGTLADITAEAGAEAAMSAARDEATEASRQKSDFLANMSHEIRTPMNGVIGMTDLLLETDLDLSQRDYAQTVRNSGEALMTIINDILDFSKVEAGKFELERVEFELRAVIDGVVDLLAGPAQAKGLDVVAAVDRSVPEVVCGDPGRVRQVLTNLLGNAIKFTHSGEVVIRVTAHVGTGSDDLIRFEVSDTGDGIANGKLASIFEPFIQADTSVSRKYGGTGLGLAISGQLVALMGGDCGVASRLGEGSTFWFTIAVEADTEQPAGDLRAPDADLAASLALVVDDNAAQRGALSDHMTGWGMSVATADSGEAALGVLRAAADDERPFGVAVIDRNMPGMGGAELLEAIASDPAIDLPVVLMNSLAREAELSAAAHSAVRATLSKPVHDDDLRGSLKVALGFAPDRAATDEAAIVPSATGPRQSGRLLLAEDNVINQKVAIAMLTNAGYRVDTVLDGVEAVEAAAARAYDAILMDCHMPELNGYDATVAIRAHEEGTGRHTPIIAMTAAARREDRERCLAAGMDSYLAKPVSKDALLTLVARSTKPPSKAVAAEPPQPVEATIDPAIFGELRALGDASGKSLLGQLVGQYLKVTEPLLVQLREAVEGDDGPEVGRLAHSLKGSSSQMGAQRLAASCSRLEAKALDGGLADGRSDVQALEEDFEELKSAFTLELAAPASDSAVTS